VDAAGVVVSPNDGAEWIQGGLDLVAPRAVRILDEPHGAEHLGTLGGLVHGADTAAAGAWVATQRRRLLEEGPADVLAELARRQAAGPHPAAPVGPDGLTPAEHLAREVAYFAKREAHIDYPAFRAAGYPIGSGIVESGHKVVVGRRCKGAGHHWAPAHLNPLLVLRTTACNDRWAATWPAIWAEQRRSTLAARRRRGDARRAARLALAPPAPAPVPAPVPAGRPAAPPAPPRPKLVVDGHPTDDHPWRRPFLPAPRRRAG
jgi:hypothetical protein